MHHSWSWNELWFDYFKRHGFQTLRFKELDAGRPWVIMENDSRLIILRGSPLLFLPFYSLVLILKKRRLMLDLERYIKISTYPWCCIKRQYLVQHVLQFLFYPCETSFMKRSVLSVTLLGNLQRVYYSVTASNRCKKKNYSTRLLYKLQGKLPSVSGGSGWGCWNLSYQLRQFGPICLLLVNCAGLRSQLSIKIASLLSWQLKYWPCIAERKV